MINKHLLLSLICAFIAMCVNAVEPVDSTTIADKINNDGFSKIIQPEKLNERLIRSTAGDDADNSEQSATTSVSGYRIQVFSSNNARTGKNEANARAEKIRAQFPEHTAYVTYDAPYWRLRVGNFQNYDDARAALAMLKNAFPDYARDMRLVRDRIKP